MSGYETGLVWGLIVGAPLVGVVFWAGKALIDEHFEREAERLGLPPVRPDEETTP